MRQALEQLPDWLPKSVVKLANVTPLQNEIRRRLLTDPRMKDVWSWLLRANSEGDERRLSSVDPILRLSTWGLDNTVADMRDQLCGAFFLQVLQELSIQTYTASKARVEAAAKPWANAAKHCRMAKQNEPFGLDLLRFDPELRQALDAAADHLQWIADSIEQKNNPRLLGKSTGEDDIVRSHVKSLTVAARSLFGSSLHGIVAKTSSVGLNLESLLSREQVEKWCSDLPPFEE